MINEPIRPDSKRIANVHLHKKYQAAICLQMEFLSIRTYEEIFSLEAEKLDLPLQPI
jgi:hypothetical protein